MKKISPVLVVGIVLTILCFLLYVSGLSFIQAITNFAYDALLKTVAVKQRSSKVMIVDLDENSLSEIGQWPWPRYLVADLVRKIFDDGASVVAFDVVFAEKDRTSPLVMQKSMNNYFNETIQLQGVPDKLMDFDHLFAEALHGKKVVMGCFMLTSQDDKNPDEESIDPHYRSTIFCKDTKTPQKFLLWANGMTISIPELSKASYTAFFNAVADPDNIVRSNPLVYGFGQERIYPSLALEAVRLCRGDSQCIVQFDSTGVQNIRLRDLVIPCDQAGRLVINYRTAVRNPQTGFDSSFTTISAADVLKQRNKRNIFDGAIVLVGTSAVGLHDLKATPLSAESADLPGVEVHATMIDNILAGDMLSKPSWMVAVDSIVILLSGLFLSVFISKGKSWLSFLISILMIGVSIEVSQILLSKYHIVFVPVWLGISIITIYLVLTMLRYWQEEMQKRKVRNMFGTMVSEDILHYLENNPGSFSLTGRRVEATMFFSDVANFTSISENLEPERLTLLLNRYLTPMTNIIMEHKGNVDKYEGDAIMAVWGAPYPLEDHAAQACLAALEQQESLSKIRAELKKEFGYDVYVRMGINTGQVAAGNMGSDRKFQFTVMGDAVNQAARFEPANKDYSSNIIIGESTYMMAKNAVEARLLDKIVVKGKTLPINIYELLAKKGELKYAKAEVVKEYEQALKLMWERQWDLAVEGFSKILELDAHDVPSAIMLARVKEYKMKPPQESWRGEYIRTSKD